MKAITTLGFIFLFTLSTLAQDRAREQKVTTISRGLVPVTHIQVKQGEKTTRIARLYRRPNARIKRALSVTTVKDRPKRAEGPVSCFISIAGSSTSRRL